jgi:hypothetical protein
MYPPREMRKSRFTLSVYGLPGSGCTSLCHQILGDSYREGPRGELLVDMAQSLPTNPRDVVMLEVVDGYVSRADVYIHLMQTEKTPLVHANHVVNCLSRCDSLHAGTADKGPTEERFLRVSCRTGVGIDKLIWIVIAIVNHRQPSSELVAFVNGHIRDVSLLRLGELDLSPDESPGASDSN